MAEEQGETLAQPSGEPRLRAKDLLRRGQLAVRPMVCGRTVERVWARYVLRPAGNSARFWRKLDGDDPFLFVPPKDANDDERRPVYASGRFVRLDRKDQDKRVSPEDALIARLRAEAAAKPRPAAPTPEPSPGAPQHRTIRTRGPRSMEPARPKPKTPPPGAAGLPKPSPPRVPTPPSRATSTGRFRSSVGSSQPRRGWSAGGAPPGGFVPKVVQEEPAAPEPPPPPRRSPPRHAQPAPEQATAPDPPPSPPAAPQAGASAPPPADPSSPPSHAAPPRPHKPASSMSMDDLFGAAAQEGRVRIKRAKKPEPKPEE